MTESARAIEHLLYAYAEAIDAGAFGRVGALFAHGRIHAVPDPPPEAVHEGADAVAAMYEATVRLYDDGTPKTKHVTTNVTIEVDDAAGRATSRSHYTVMQATPDLALQAIITGHYDDTFHLVGGEWWFDTRTMFVDQVGDLSHHLLFELR